MTSLTKPISRVVALVVDYRRRARTIDNVVVTLDPAGDIHFRVKGHRTTHSLPLATVYALAIKASKRPS